MKGGSEHPKSVIYEATESQTKLTWLEIDVSDLSQEEQVKIAESFRGLTGISHPNIIGIGKYGLTETGMLVLITTEQITKNTIEKYILENGLVPVATAQLWGSQVVSALVSLHSCSPPIVHRALRCDHLVVDQVTSCKVFFAYPRLDEDQRKAVHFVAYIPPELYDNDVVTPKVDVYALGMCMLHMLTGKRPYEECKHAPEVYKRVEDGTLPAAIAEIADVDAHNFVEVCLQPVESRPTASDLLSHPFIAKATVPKVAFSGGKLKGVNGSKISICLTLSIKGKQKEIAFPFDMDKDTAEGIASEMVGDVPILAEGGPPLRDAIQDCILRLIQEAQGTSAP